MKKFRKLVLTSVLTAVLISSGCGASAENLDHDNPVTLTMWHVYGEQAESPMNSLVEEFNNTVGREKGILIDVTAMSNAGEIGQQLLDAQDNRPGAGDMPDLFFCHPANAAALGTDSLFDWKSCFSEDELSDFVPEFIREGTLDGKLTILPVSKSTLLLFLNGTQFARFSQETGVTPDHLATWDGFYDTAEKYYKWSGGKPFCAFDYILLCLQLEAESDGSSVITQDGWFDLQNENFRRAYLRFARALAEGSVVISDQYSNTQIMTGEVLSGISSSAAILYYNDTVTYPDNTSEPLNLEVLPCPHATDGTWYATQAGVGLCALSLKGRKAAAASVFAHWLTESSRNLKFVTSTGYMPVRSAAFQEISGYSFTNPSYAGLYSALEKVRDTCIFKPEPSDSGFFDKTGIVYDEIKKRQTEWHERFLRGEDADRLAEECWQITAAIH